MATMISSADLETYCSQMAERAQRAARELAVASGEAKNRWLTVSAQSLRGSADELIRANAADIAEAPRFGLSAAQVDRVRLDGRRIDEMARALEEIAMLRDPVGEVIEGSVRPNGLEVLKVRVPLGVILFIYESRPNVTADAAALCVKSSNAVILRGGKEALNSNLAIHRVLAGALDEAGLPTDAVQLVETPDRQAVSHLLGLDQYIDLAIPRGGEGLIRRVAEEARMPVMKHYKGNCHVYVDRSAELEMAERIVVSAKCERPGVCNAAESLLVHRAVAERFLPSVAAELHRRGVELRGCPETRRLVPDAAPAAEEDYAAEYLDLILSLRVVKSLDEAIQHINRYGSKHTDAIVTSELAAAREFAARVDSSAVMINASTRFNDGGQFGLGAEIGISTDKFHARGPCGLKELTSYKYVVYGNGQIRE